MSKEQQTPKKREVKEERKLEEPTIPQIKRQRTKNKTDEPDVVKT
jgi:hypothetical protein